MLNLKKFYSDELLHLALILSLLRVDPNSYLGLDIQAVRVGSLDLNNGSGWHTDAHTIIHRPAYVHPKNLDSILLNYERDLFEDLNALGRYNRINTAHNRIHAYLLNIDDKAGPSTTAVTDAENNAGHTNIPNPPMPSQTTDENLESAELTQEDMDLIEVLWKQDVDLGFTLVEPTTTKNSPTSSKKESEDDIEKLKTLEAINAAHDKKESEVKEELPKQEDPWAELPYTVDLETGEYILNTGSSGSASGSSSSSSSEQQQRSLKNPGAEEEEEEQLLGEASLRLGNVDELVGLGDDSLGLSDGLGLENDFTNELLSDGLLNSCTAVDGFLSNDSLTSFNLEEALQLVGLDEVQLEKKPEVKKNDEDSDGARSESRASTSENDEDAGANGAAAEPPADIMIHTPQYHHPHHPHHRSYQSRVPFMRTMSMEQRWPDIAPFFSVPNGTDHFAHPGHHHHHHHHHHPSYTSLGAAAAAGTAAHHHTGYDAAQRNVLLHNATLAPPVGDLNSTGSYHPAGGPSNLGSAVATSMNLTNSSEPMGPDTGAAYKAEPTDMMYYPNTTTDSLNQTTDSIFSALLDEQLGWNNEDLTFNVSDGLYGGAGGGVQSGAENGAGGAAAASSLPNIPSTSLGPVADERMDASSDSAVSSMGSERVPSLSDGEWMETGSNSSHTHADSHYSMDYTGKYRMPYDCGYGVAGARGQRGAMAPVAQKKHHMFGKRCFQEGQGPPMPAAAAATAHQPSPVKYDYETAAQGVAAAAPPGHAYSGPIEGAAAAPQSEIKYSCSLDFARHHAPRSSLEHVHHNHTYHLPPESSTSLQRPVSRDKKSRKNDADEHLTRDEKRARQQSVPIPVQDIINLPMDEFNERLSKYDLSESQLSLIRDIRRRGKNKVAAQNCRKRKLDQINNLSDEVRDMRSRKIRLLDERNYMLSEVARVKEKFGQLYRHIFHSLRDPEGRPYNQHEYSLQLSADGNVVLVPRTGQPGSHYTRSSVEPSKPIKPEQQQQHHHQHHQQHHHHHDGRKD